MKKLLALPLLAIALAACERAEPPAATTAAESAPAPLDPRRDYHSYANTDAFVARHLTLDLAVDFAAQTLAGTATLDLERKGAGAPEIVLDTRDLDIVKAESAAGEGAWAETTFALEPRDPLLGSALRIALPADATRVRVTYATRPEATGLQWVTPAQTAGKRQPFLYTQAQAIHARSFVPLQDTPGVRLTYDATIRTPKALIAVMAAEFDAAAPRDGEFQFRMPQAIPSYLIALAVGDLKFKSMGPRTGIWAEPSVVDAAAREFADTEAMMAKAEALYGPYRWGRYDVLILPPSFPWGGMENPRLTFASPTVIAGDKSLVSLVAHELAHSWSGNLVTNATWRDAWLNEGFTTYFEGRIMEAVYGPARARMEQGIGQADLREALAGLAPADKALGALAPDLRGRDPDEGFSRVPYEKGALFLRQLERRFGRETFDAFLRGWFDRHAFSSVATPDFLEHLGTELLAKHPGKADPAFVERWVFGTDVPADAVFVESDALQKVDAVREAWQQGGALDALASAARTWSVSEWIRFLDSLPRDLAADRMRALDQRFKLTASTNSEIAHAWFKLAIANRYSAADAALERYLTSIGRRKLIVPLYRELVKSPEGMAFAKRVYEQARPSYHAVAQKTLDPVVNPPAA